MGDGSLLGCGLVGGLLATWTVRTVALRWGIVNQPNPIVPQHRQPVAYLGGVGIALPIAVALAIAAFELEPPFLPSAGTQALARALGIEVVLPALLLLGLGVVDDLRPLSPRAKLMGQGVAATVAVLAGLVYPFTGYRWLDALCSWGSIVTLVNAWNLVDVCDGLAAGLAVVSLGVLGMIDPAQAPLALLIAGACLGFLVFNRPPASIFMGDAGSLMLGFWVAALALRTPPDAPPWLHAARLGLVAAVPLFELGFLVVIRHRRGLPWWKGSPDHFALRLQARGYSRGQTILAAWSVALLCGLTAVVLPDVRTETQGLLALVFLGSAAGLGRWLASLPVPHK